METTVATRFFPFTPPNTPKSLRSRTDHSSSDSLSRTFSTCSFSRHVLSSRRSVSQPSGLCLLARSSVAAGLTSKQMELPSAKTVGINDLLIIGPGVLGRIAAEKWREEHPGCQIFGQTVTTDHHNELVAIGIQPSVKGTTIDEQFSNVIYCAPPSRTPDYAADLREAILKWNGEGSFLFTSSSAPYNCFDNGSCDEAIFPQKKRGVAVKSGLSQLANGYGAIGVDQGVFPISGVCHDGPVVPLGKSPRTDVLLKAEAVVLEYGGCVLRLAGLYKEGRGAHTYWLEKGTIDARPDHILNLIHYEDAASLAITIMKKKLRGRIFLGCDNHPLSRQEVMDIVEKSGKFSKKFQGFTGTSDPLGKRLNNSKTRTELGWEPKYPSFAHFLGVTE